MTTRIEKPYDEEYILKFIKMAIVIPAYRLFTIIVDYSDNCYIQEHSDLRYFEKRREKSNIREENTYIAVPYGKGKLIYSLFSYNKKYCGQFASFFSPGKIELGIDALLVAIAINNKVYFMVSLSDDPCITYKDYYIQTFYFRSSCIALRSKINEQYLDEIDQLYGTLAKEVVFIDELKDSINLESISYYQMLYKQWEPKELSRNQKKNCVSFIRECIFSPRLFDMHTAINDDGYKPPTIEDIVKIICEMSTPEIYAKELLKTNQKPAIKDKEYYHDVPIPKNKAEKMYIQSVIEKAFFDGEMSIHIAYIVEEAYQHCTNNRKLTISFLIKEKTHICTCSKVGLRDALAESFSTYISNGNKVNARTEQEWVNDSNTLDFRTRIPGWAVKYIDDIQLEGQTIYKRSNQVRIP